LEFQSQIRTKLAKTGLKADDWAMLLEFRVENHRSIQKEQALSLEAGSSASGTVVQEGETPAPTAQVLPVALIYGANASGKSNVLSALSFMTDAVLFSQRQWEPQGKIPRNPFAWAGQRSQSSVYEVTILMANIRVNYGFTITDTKVEEEWLSAWPKGRKQMWFERDDTSFKFGEHLKGPNEAVRELTRENALYLSAAAQLGHPQLTPLYAWFHQVISSANNLRRTWLPDYRFLELLFPQPTLFPLSDWGDSAADQIRHLLSMADVGIVDLQIRSEDLARGRRNRVLLQHQEGDEDSWLELEAESEGTISLLRLATPLCNVLQNGGILVIDELERSLHPSVCAAILELFLRPESNPKNAQLIATTHDTALLGNSLGRARLAREHIWFTEKNQAGATELYPLTDYKPRAAENLERGYLQGRYGAIPFLGDLSWATKDKEV
jgi:predicted ATPase